MSSTVAMTLCDEMRRLSVDTWERIGFARSRVGLKVYETTITQNLLFELKKFSEHYKTGFVHMFEATNEKANGNDIEIFVQIGNKYICLPTQAKILYSDGKYPRMEHGNQIKDLIKYAKLIGGYPLYLLYNYDLKSNPTLNNYGSSIVSAHYLSKHYTYKTSNKKWIIPSFSDLNPSISEPWEILACDTLLKLEELFLKSSNTSLIPSDFKEIKEYTREEVFDNPKWKHFSSISSNQDTDAESDNEVDAVGFEPKFRIVISNQKIGKNT